MLQATLIILYTPWLWIFIIELIKARPITFGARHSLIYSIFLLFAEYAGSGWLLLSFLVLSFFSIWVIKNRRLNIDLPNIKKIYLLLLWLFIPVIAISLISKFAYYRSWARYTIAASLAFYLLAAKGLKHINYRYAKRAAYIWKNASF